MPAVGYSGTPLPKKLGIREGQTVVLLDAPPDIEREIEPLPADVKFNRGLPKGAALEMVLLFTTKKRAFQSHLRAVESALADDGTLWVCWPKKASGVPTEVGEADVREIGLASGLVDVKVCAVTEIWSGLKFVRRLVDRKSKVQSRKSKVPK